MSGGYEGGGSHIWPPDVGAPVVNPASHLHSAAGPFPPPATGQLMAGDGAWQRIRPLEVDLPVRPSRLDHLRAAVQDRRTITTRDRRITTRDRRTTTRDRRTTATDRRTTAQDRRTTAQDHRTTTQDRRTIAQDHQTITRDRWTSPKPDLCPTSDCPSPILPDCRTVQSQPTTQHRVGIQTSIGTAPRPPPVT